MKTASQYSCLCVTPYQPWAQPGDLCIPRTWEGTAPEHWGSPSWNTVPDQHLVYWRLGGQEVTRRAETPCSAPTARFVNEANLE